MRSPAQSPSAVTIVRGTWSSHDQLRGEADPDVDPRARRRLLRRPRHRARHRPRDQRSTSRRRGPPRRRRRGRVRHAVVLATGAEPRRLDRPRSRPRRRPLPAHHRRLACGSATPSAAPRASPSIGAGWIGSEVAASARQMGADVVLIDPAPGPAARACSATRSAGCSAQLHADHGVDAATRHRRRASCAAPTGRAGRARRRPRRGRRRRRRRRRRRPRTELAEQPPACASTTASSSTSTSRPASPGVYAAGDVANAWHPHYGRHLRVEHWANALNQGVTAGRNAAGGARRLRPAAVLLLRPVRPRHGVRRLQPTPDDAVVVRGDLDEREFIAFWHRDGVVTAAMNVNVWDVVEDLKAIIGGGRRFDALACRIRMFRSPTSPATR